MALKEVKKLITVIQILIMTLVVFGHQVTFQ